MKWSISSINTLRRCHRQYYFSKLASVSSCAKVGSIEKECSELKNMTSLFMWAGKLVEKGIELYILNDLNNKNLKDKAIENTFELAKKQFKFSASQEYKTKSKTKAGDEYCILDIHYLNLPFSQYDIDEVYKKIKVCFNNLFQLYVDKYQCSLLDLLKSASFTRTNIQNYVFDFEDIKVSPQIDLLLYVNNKPVIIDWKVVKGNSDYAKQLAICGFAVHKNNEKWAEENNKPKPALSDIDMFEINLLQAIIKHYKMDKSLINQTVDYIYETSYDLKIIEEFKDEKKYKDLDINYFSLTDNENTCAICNYSTVCQKMLVQKKKQNENTTYQLF